MVLEAALLKIHLCKVKGTNPVKGVVAYENGAFGSPSTTVGSFFYFYLKPYNCEHISCIKNGYLKL